VSRLPSAITFSTDSTDAWGWDFVELDFGDDVYILVCPNSQGEYGEGKTWIDFNGNEDVEDTITIAVENQMCMTTEVPMTVTTVKALTGSMEYSDTSGYVTIQFEVNGDWTDEKSFFWGSNYDDFEVVAYPLPNLPSAIKFTLTESTDAWGYDYVELDFGNDEYVLVCRDSEEEFGPDGNWIDGNTEGLSNYVVLNVVNQTC
jgi:hypothetical protein